MGKKEFSKRRYFFISIQLMTFIVWFKKIRKRSLISLEKYIKNLKEIQQELGLLGVNLIVNSGIPLLKQDPDTSQWFASLNNKCKIKKILNQDKIKRLN